MHSADISTKLECRGPIQFIGQQEARRKSKQMHQTPIELKIVCVIDELQVAQSMTAREEANECRD